MRNLANTEINAIPGGKGLIKNILKSIIGIKVGKNIITEIKKI